MHLLLNVFIFAQTLHAFDVASIKAGDRSSPTVGIHANAARFNAVNTPLKLLIQFAFEVDEYQISGGPAWLGTAAFTIDAKAGDNEPLARNGNAAMRAMLQSLLVDRFALLWHWKTRDVDTYDLVQAKGGARLQLTDPSYRGQDLNGEWGRLTGRGVPIDQLIASLSRQLGRPIIDATGLRQRYDFTLTYIPEVRDSIFGRSPIGPTDPPPGPDAVSLFTAIEEQLGLKLQTSKGRIKELVIDRAEMPSPD